MKQTLIHCPTVRRPIPQILFLAQIYSQYRLGSHHIPADARVVSQLGTSLQRPKLSCL